MTVADRIAVMDRGRLIQVAPPAEIYEQPNSRWVADFIGSVNLLEGRVGPDGTSVEGTALGRLHVGAKIPRRSRRNGVRVAVRPEQLRMTPNPAADPQAALENDVAATLTDVAYLGDLSIYRLRTDAKMRKRAGPISSSLRSEPMPRTIKSG